MTEGVCKNKHIGNCHTCEKELLVLTKLIHSNNEYGQDKKKIVNGMRIHQNFLKKRFD